MATMGVIDPVRQAFLHREIPSGQRATVVSFQQIFIGGGSVVGQLALGYCANVASIPAAYALGGCLSLLSLPPIFLLRSFRRDTDAFAPPPEASTK
jgi:MFS family permease